MSVAVTVVEIAKSPVDVAVLRRISTKVFNRLKVTEGNVVIVVRNIHRLEGLNGRCNPNRTVSKPFNSLAVKSYVLELNSANNTRQLIKTLLHEIRHVWQHENNSCKIHDPKERELPWAEREFEKDAMAWAEKNIDGAMDLLVSVQQDEFQILRDIIEKRDKEIVKIKAENNK